MTLLQLQYFRTLARVLHYTRAAEELHIAQPSLSYSISELEKELDVKLFDKEGRKVLLTVYGPTFSSRWRAPPSRWSGWAISTPSPPPSSPP